MTQETKIKYILIKLNMNLQRNVSDIIYLPEIVKEKLMSHSTQGFVNYVKLL